MAYPMLDSERALDNLVELIMKGESFPKKRFGQHEPQVCLEDVLQDLDNLELGALICEEIAKQGMGEILRRGLENMLKNLLHGSEWHSRMDAEMAQDCAEDARAEAADDRREHRRDIGR